MSQVILIATYFYVNEDGDLINVKFYQDADTLRLTMWEYDPKEQKQVQAGYAPTDIQDGVDWYSNKRSVVLQKASTTPSAEFDSLVDNPSAATSDPPDVIPFNVSDGPSFLDAAMLAQIINESLESSVYAEDIRMEPNDNGHLEVRFRSAIAVIAIGVAHGTQ